jgi:xylulokinase
VTPPRQAKPKALRQAITVGIDIGTTSVKAVAADVDGRVVSRLRLPHRLVVPSPSRLEHDAVQAWWDGPRAAWDALATTEVAAVAVSAMVPALCAVGPDGRPLGAGVLYGDERGRPDGIVERGAPTATHETAELLRWWAGELPGASGYWPAQAVANRALGGDAAIDYGSAYSSGVLFDGTGWDLRYCGDCGVKPDQLPAVVMFGDPVGEIRSGPARGAVIGAGGADAWCEQLVAGVEGVGDVLVVCGSTLVVWTVTDGWPSVDGLWTLPHTVAGRALLGGASNAGGLFLDWVDRVVAPASTEVRDPGGVPVWWPFIRGERAPLFDPERRAGLAGADLTHGPAELRRAAFEASAFAARNLMERAGTAGARTTSAYRPGDQAVSTAPRTAGASPARIVAAGGGTRARGWMQALADVTGVAVHPLAIPESAALGAAYLARMAAGLEASVEGAARWGALGAPIEPDPAWVGPVAERYGRYLQPTR